MDGEESCHSWFQEFLLGSDVVVPGALGKIRRTTTILARAVFFGVHPTTLGHIALVLAELIAMLVLNFTQL